MVPRWGVLYNTTEVLDNRYSGTIFVRTDATGHMFNQHYMDIMFPLELLTEPADKSNDQILPLLDNTFLDKVVDVDEKTARKREIAASRKMGLMRQESGIEFGDGQAVPVRRPPVSGDNDSSGRGRGSHRGAAGDRRGAGEAGEDHGIDGIDGMDDEGFVNAGEAAVLGLGREARGKTVRELSRLWMYIGGGSPEEK